jgi:hypothetical protein
MELEMATPIRVHRLALEITTQTHDYVGLEMATQTHDYVGLETVDWIRVGQL